MVGDAGRRPLADLEFATSACYCAGTRCSNELCTIAYVSRDVCGAVRRRNGPYARTSHSMRLIWNCVADLMVHCGCEDWVNMLRAENHGASNVAQSIFGPYVQQTCSDTLRRYPCPSENCALVRKKAASPIVGTSQ